MDILIAIYFVGAAVTLIGLTVAPPLKIKKLTGREPLDSNDLIFMAVMWPFIAFAALADAAGWLFGTKL